jgi:class 3 adenylate cyclase
MRELRHGVATRREVLRRVRRPGGGDAGGAPGSAHPHPKRLAQKILQSKSALEGERKQVTVLFADVQGSMELAEQMDPEAWSRIMQRFFTILAAAAPRIDDALATADRLIAETGARNLTSFVLVERAALAALRGDAERSTNVFARPTRGSPAWARPGVPARWLRPRP